MTLCEVRRGVLVVVFLVLLRPLMAPRSAEAQVHIGESIQVSTENQSGIHTEVQIAADPRNPKRLLACSMLHLEGGQNAVHDVSYLSEDGGESWSEVSRIQASLWANDPACIFGPDGKAYFAGLVADEVRGEAEYSTVVNRSEDGGRTWVTLPSVPIADRPFFSVVGDSLNATVYLGGMLLSKSVEQSSTHAHELGLFSSNLDKDSFLLRSVFAGTYNPSGSKYFDVVIATDSPVVGLPDGALLAGVQQVRFDVEKSPYYDQSHFRFRTGPSLGVYPGSIKVIRLDSEGMPSSDFTVVSDFYSCNFVTTGGPIAAMVADTTSKFFAGRIYIAWADAHSGRCEIMFSRSLDGGTTWSLPISVNDDLPNRSEGGPDHFRPQLAVNREGIIGCLWYDRRDSPDNLSWRARFSASLDGGETFLPSVPVSDIGTSVQLSRRRHALFGTVRGGRHRIPGFRGDTVEVLLGHLPNHGISGGDTAGLVADKEGAFHPLWVDNRTGILQVWTAKVTVQGTALPNGSVSLSCMNDVTKDVTLEVTNVQYDVTNHKVTADVSLINTSKAILRGPLLLRVLRVRSETGTAQILAPRAIGSEHIVDFTPLLADGTLEPNASSGKISVSIGVQTSQPEAAHLTYREVIGLVRFEARVLQGPFLENGKTCSSR